MTGEELYTLYNQAKDHVHGPLPKLEWAVLVTPIQQAWNHCAMLVDQAQPPTPYQSPAIGPHVPSQIPDIVPLPKDRSWEQFYPGKPVIDEARVRELYNAGRTKDWLLRAFANLSRTRLDEILAS